MENFEFESNEPREDKGHNKLGQMQALLQSAANATSLTKCLETSLKNFDVGNSSRFFRIADTFNKMGQGTVAELCCCLA